MDKGFVKCDRDCAQAQEGKCRALGEVEIDTEKCPFYKSMVDAAWESGALTAVPHPDWEAFRRHSGTSAVTVRDLALWLADFERVCPTDDPYTREILTKFLTGEDVIMTRKEVTEKIVDWLKRHPEGCGWCMSPEETAKRILERSVDDADEINETETEVSE